MKWVPEVLQLPIIINGRRVLAFKPQPLEEVDFLLCRITAQGRVLQKGLQPRLLATRHFADPFKKLKFLQVLGD